MIPKVRPFVEHWLRRSSMVTRLARGRRPSGRLLLVLCAVAPTCDPDVVGSLADAVPMKGRGPGSSPCAAGLATGTSP